MFIGHFGVAFAAKKAAPSTSLGTLFLSTQLVDLLWPLFLLLGVEHVRIDPGNTAVTPLDFYDYPLTHSLVAVIGWSVALGLGYFAVRKYRRGAAATGLAVFSHWILDFLTHRPDLPLAPGSNVLFGAGLWNSSWGTVMVEGSLFVIGLTVYLRTTQARDKTGSIALWSLVAFLVLIYVSNLVSPPPPSVDMIAIAGNAGWLLVAWAYWVDRHRSLLRASSTEPEPAAPGSNP